MKGSFYLLMMTFLCCACSRGKYYMSDVFRKGDVGAMDAVTLDSTYHFYLREVYRDKNPRQENILRSNLAKNDTANKTRIEVEYLLLSWVHKNALYISTVPDKFQRYYSSNRFADTLINAYDFSTFHFGKISDDGESISFTSANGKKRMIWDMRPFINPSFPNKVLIREIAIERKEMLENVILIDKALEEPVSFTRQNSFTIIFEKPGSNADTSKNITALCRMSDPKIYLRRDRYGIDLFFRFDRALSDSQDSAIRFDSRRMRYPPVELQYSKR